MKIYENKIEELEEISKNFYICFDEFFKCLRDVDISDKTKEWLYDIFIKDTKRYLKEIN